MRRLLWFVLGLAVVGLSACSGRDLAGEPVEIGGEGAIDPSQVTDFVAARQAFSTSDAAVALPAGATVTDLAGATVVLDDRSQSVVVQGVAETPAGEATALVGTFYGDDGTTETVTMFAFDDVALDEIFGGFGSLRATAVFATFGGPGGPIPISPIAADLLDGRVPETEPGSTTYTIVLDPENVGGLATALELFGVDGPAVFQAIVPGPPFVLLAQPPTFRLPTGEQGTELFGGWLTLQPPSLAIDSNAGAFYLESIAGVDLDGGGPMRFAQRMYVDDPAGGSYELVDVWARPFGLAWLATDSASMTIGDAGVAVAANSTLRDVELAVILNITSDGLATLTASPGGGLVLQDAVDLIAEVAGVPTFPVGTEPTLRNVALRGRLGAGDPVLSLTASGTLGAVEAGITVAPGRSSSGEPLVLARLSLADISLGEAISATAGSPVGDLRFPGANFLLTNAGPSGMTEVDLSSVDPVAIAGLAQEGGTLVVPAGVGFRGALPFVNLDSGFREMFGLTGGGEIVFDGVVGADLSAVSGSAVNPALRLRAALPGGLFPDPPAPLVASGDGLELTIEYHDGVTALEVRTVAVAEVGVETLTVDLFASRDADGVLVFRGALADPWAAPFGIDWLTMSDVSLTARSRPEANVTFFAAADTTLGLSGTVDVFVDRDQASITAALDGEIAIGSLFDLVTQEVGGTPFPGLADRFTVGDIVLELTMGDDPSFGISGTTSVDVGATTFAADVAMVSARQDGTSRFTLGVLPEGAIALADLSETLPPGLEDVALDHVAFVLSTRDLRFDRLDLTSIEAAFYESIYGSIDPDGRIATGLNVVATMDMPTALEPLATSLWIDTSNPFVIQGTIPGSVLGLGGSTSFGLTGLMPQITPPPGEAPDWLDSGRLLLGIGAGDASLGGILRINVPDENDPSGVEQLTFGIETQLDLANQSIELVGFLEADAWEQPFGLEWLTLNQAALLLGVTATPPAVTLGFSGDAVIVEKDFQAAMVVGFTPIPVPLAARFATESGLTLGDLTSLVSLLDPNGVGISAEGLPDLGLSFIELSYGLKDYPALGIERGFVVAGDLYLDASGEPGDPEALCVDRKANGCIASVRVRIVPEGIEARGEIVGFEAGPIIWEDGIIDFVLTATEQHLYIDGGATVADALTGRITLDVTATEMSARGIVELFGFEAELIATGEVDLDGPAFAMQATLRSDFAGYVVDQTIPLIVALSDRLDEVISIWADLEDRPATGFARLEDLLVDEGLPVPFWMTATADTIDAINSAVSAARSLGINFVTPDDVVLAALNGVTIVPEVTGRRDPIFGSCLPDFGQGGSKCTIISEVRIPGACDTFAQVACTARENAEADLRKYLAHTSGLTIDPDQLDAYLPTIEAQLEAIISSAIPLEVTCASVAGSLDALAGDATLETALVMQVLGDTQHYSLAWNFLDGAGSAARLLTNLIESTQSSNLCEESQESAPALGDPVVDESLDEVEESPSAFEVTQTAAEVTVAAEETAAIEAAESGATTTSTVAATSTTTAETTVPVATTVVSLEPVDAGGGVSVALLGLVVSLLGAAGGGLWWWRSRQVASATGHGGE